MGAIKEHSNQIVKILICLCLTFVFIFVQPKENAQQAEAIVPVLLWGGSLIASIVAEEAIEMGIRHYTADGKTATKSKSKKIADEIFGELDSYGFDFLKSNPKRKADGSLEVNMSANDRAKIARKIADEFDDILMAGMLPRFTGDGSSSITNAPLSPGVSSSDDAFAVAQHFVTTDVSNDSSDDTLYDVNMFTYLGDAVPEFPISKAPNYYVNKFKEVKPATNGGYHLTFDTYKNGVFHTSRLLSIQSALKVEVMNFLLYRNIGKGVVRSSGMSVPVSLGDVYPAPKNMSPTYQLPNYNELSNKPFKIPNMFVPDSSDSDVTWEVVNEKYVADEITFVENIDNVTNTKIENEGDLVTNTYNTQTINNYYTDSNYPVKSDDVTVIVDVDTPPPVVIDDDTTTGGLTKVEVDIDGFKHCVDKSTNTVIPCKDIEGIDGGLLAYVRDSYNYAVNAVKTAVNGLETIATGSVGLIALYSEIFDWLPDEVTVLLTSGLMLMIGLRVFRK